MPDGIPIADTGEYNSGPVAGIARVSSTRFTDKPLKYADVDGFAIFEGDIVLGRVDVIKAQQGLVGLGLTGTDFLWPFTVVPFEIDAALPNQQRVLDAVEHWNALTFLRFRPRTPSDNDFVRFVPDPKSSGSLVGRQLGRQDIRVADTAPFGTVVHEMGHAIGLHHEHSREDRNQFIEVRTANIEEDRRHNFEQEIVGSEDIGPYDFGSVMHYDALAFSVNGQDTIVPKVPIPQGTVMGQRDRLSPGDVKAANQLYADVPPPPPTF